jgi:hypothetical protein
MQIIVNHRGDLLMGEQTESSSKKARRMATAVGVSLVMAFLGYEISGAGYRVLRQWSSIGTAFAGIGVLWLFAGPAMLLAALWVLASLGRHRIPFRVAGCAAVVAALALVLGVLSNIVPCSGPS